MITMLLRTLGAVLATVLATTATAAASPEADRREADRVPTYRAAASVDDPISALGLAADRRAIYSKVEWRRGVLWLRGDVEDHARGLVAVQKRRCETCRWKLHDVTRTGKRGWFRSQIVAPRRGSTFWRARVAASGGYGRSYSVVWETYY